MLTLAQLRNATPTTITVDAQDAVKWWATIKTRFAELRGFDLGDAQKPIPRTTIADVMSVATAISEALARVRRDTHADRSIRERWRREMAAIEDARRAQKPTDPYPHNARFWQSSTARVAIHLESVKVLPSRWILAVDSVGESVAELPGRVGGAARTVAGGAGDTIGALFSSPLLLGTAAVVGGALLLRK